MSDVTVSQLAESINTSVERLLKQMADAGLPQRQSGDNVSDEQKQILLQHLRESHGAVSDADSGVKKITLKRKTLSTIKTGSGTARKTVSVEVRKKRTYIKREDSDADAASVDEELPDIEGIELDNYTFFALEMQFSNYDYEIFINYLNAIKENIKDKILYLYRTKCCDIDNYISKLFFDPEN